jgi:hypothetical protein
LAGYDYFMPHAATLQQPARPPPLLSDPQILSIEVAPATDGSLWVTSTGTYVDGTRLEFVNDDVEHVRGASLDEALAVIRRVISDTLLPNHKEGHRQWQTLNRATAHTP